MGFPELEMGTHERAISNAVARLYAECLFEVFEISDCLLYSRRLLLGYEAPTFARQMDQEWSTLSQGPLEIMLISMIRKNLINTLLPDEELDIDFVDRFELSIGESSCCRPSSGSSGIRQHGSA